MTNNIIQVIDENGNEFKLANGGKPNQFAFGNFQIYYPQKENFDLSELVFIGQKSGKTLVHTGMGAVAEVRIWQGEVVLDAITLQNMQATRPEYGTGNLISEDMQFHMSAAYQHSLVHALNIPHDCAKASVPNAQTGAGEAEKIVAALKGASK